MECDDDQFNEFEFKLPEPNNIFGEIQFSGLNQIAKYAYLEGTSSDEELMEHIIVEKWKLQKPKLIINIYGSNFEKKKKLRTIFKKGLWKAAESTGCWIVTGGFNFGIMKLVGEALRDYVDAYGGEHMLAIGVSSFHGIRNKETLCTPSKEETTPIIYKSEDDSLTSELLELNSSDESSLDTNHTHFLMVDNGLPHVKGHENSFRVQFENYISHWQEDDTNGKVPMCGLLVGGDRFHIHQVYSALIKNQCPIVVLKGTGGAADALSNAWEVQFLDSSKTVDTIDEEEHLQNAINDSVEFLRTNPFDVYDFSVEVEMLKEIIKTMSHLVEIFDMENDIDLDRRMIASLLSSAGQKISTDQLNLEQLNMCLALNRPDIARDKIFLENVKWKKGDLNNYMFQALMDDRHEFVRLILEQGFSLEEFLTVFMLEKLYTDQLKKLNSKIAIFHNLWERYCPENAKKSKVSMKNVGEIICVLLGDFYRPYYLSEEFSHKLKKNLNTDNEIGTLNQLMPSDNLDEHQLDEFDEKKYLEMRKKNVHLERPAKDLMVWSILVGKLQMAELFWTMEKEPIAGALLSKMILTALEKRTDDFTDKEDFQNYASFFELRAEGVLNECYREDEQRAQQLIHRELKHYGSNSCIILSAQGQSIRFMAHPCCQDFLTSIWMGNLSPKNAIGRMVTGILLGLTLPFFLPQVMHYNAEVEKHENENKSGKQISPIHDKGRRMSTRYIRLESTNIELEKSSRDPHSLKFLITEKISRILDFYMAPSVRFVYNTLAYFTFLFLFSYMLLFDFQINIRPIEGLVIAWMITLLLEEIKQATINGDSFSTYISDGWNKLDFLAVTLYIIGFILRIISLTQESNSQYFELKGMKPELYDELFIAGRIFFAFSLFAYYIRLMYIFSFHIALGPKLIMIGKMVINDLIPFMLILLVFVFGYGVASYSISYPQGYYTPLINSTNPSQMPRLTVFSNFIIKAYYTMFGEYGLDEMQGFGDTCKNDGECPHFTSKWLVPIMLAIYVLLTNILMFNLLIAMFSRTYEMVESSSIYYWNYQRYEMIQEYVERSPLAPPLIFIWQIYELILYIYRRCKGINLDELEDPFKKSYKNNLKKERELSKWECMKSMDYLRSLEASQPGSKQQGINMKSIVLRASVAPAGGALNMNAATSAMQQQMSEATDALRLEMEKQFREIDTTLQRFNEVEDRLTDLKSTLTILSDVMGNIVQNQLESTEKLNKTTLCQCSNQSTISEETLRAAVQAAINQDIPIWFTKSIEQIIEAARNGTTASDVIIKPELETVGENISVPKNLASTEEVVSNVQNVSLPEEVVTLISLRTDLELELDERKHVIIPDVTDPRIGRIIERKCLNHRIWRVSPFNFEKYPGMRMNVPTDRTPWHIEYFEYFPYDASEEVLIFPTQASHDSPSTNVRDLVYNKYDETHRIRRQSRIRKYSTDLSTGAPLNPMGRTGLKEKGLLPRWGPNHALIPIITRWCRQENGEIILRNGLPMLETITLTHNKQLCLPWYLADHLPHCDFDKCAPVVLTTLICRRLKDVTTELTAEQVCNSIENSQVVQVFKGYLNDHLNADNGWIEAVVINIHENDNWKFDDTLLKVFEESSVNELIKWTEINYNTAMRSSHNDLLKIVALNRDAYF